MKKFKILIPVYNDWNSLIKLLQEINSVIDLIDVKCDFSCLIVNDSSNIELPIINIPANISRIDIVNMKINKGHARCNAFGLRYLAKKKNFDYLIVMDSDGEDRPIEIKSLIEKVLSEPLNSVVAVRIKRSEGIFFKSLYQIHKLIILIFTGKKINFGNYCCLTLKDVEVLSEKKSLWSSFSGTVKKYLSNINEVSSIRGKRYFGPSKMSLYNLVIHSLAIAAVFKYQVLIRSTLTLFIILILSEKLFLIKISFSLLIVIFNLLIFTVSLRENYKDFSKSHINIDSIKEITHY